LLRVLQDRVPIAGSGRDGLARQYCKQTRSLAFEIGSPPSRSKAFDSKQNLAIRASARMRALTALVSRR
jgi:hypothetical protein